MSRYTGPRVRRARRLDTDLPGLTRKTIERRPFPPGQHGQGRRRRPSEYGMQLTEKQKLVFNYGLRERQMQRLVEEAKRGAGTTGDRVLEFLERRIDSSVFRAGFARTIPDARQLVNHGHILVDDKKIDIASYRLRVGQRVSLRRRTGVVAKVENAIALHNLPAAQWLDIKPDELSFTVRERPGPEALLFEVDMQLVVEYYSR
ncbi:MAG: 30S ribosomal protein S4 [Nannocystaceae bacterium]|nr:30S ribosomal protein S4 [Nannocystaceae bacterium]